MAKRHRCDTPEQRSFIHRVQLPCISLAEARDLTALCFGVLTFETPWCNPLPVLLRPLVPVRVFPLEPRHVYAWYHVLRAVALRAAADRVLTCSAHMPWSRLLSLTGMLLCLSGRKPCHISSRRVLLSVLSLAASHGGTLSLDSSRYSSGNFVYVLFSPHNHYVYFGETCTPGREH